jgi:integrase
VLYTARITVAGNRRTVDLGDERDGVTSLEAERRLADILDDVRLGRWTDEGAAVEARPEPSMVEAAAEFVEYKRSRQLRDATIVRLRWALEAHLIPYLGRVRPSEIDEETVRAYAEHEVAQRERIAKLRAEDRYLTGPGGGALRELSNGSINSTLRVLTEMLDWCVSRGWGAGPSNPAAGYRLEQRERVTFALEADELADLLEAVGTPRPPRRPSARTQALRETVVRLREERGLEWKAIGTLVDLAASTALYHYQRAKETRARVDSGRAAVDRVFASALAWSGARVSELCNLDVSNVDLAHAKFRIPDSKTPTGVRDVDMTPALTDLVAEYFASRKGLSRSEPAFPDVRGNRRTKDSVNSQVLKPAARLANELRGERGAPELPHVTPHVLRHTYITLAFEAGYSVPYVMQQVGHREPRTTMTIYAKVSARRDRAAHHAAFDRLIGEAGDVAEPVGPVAGSPREAIPVRPSRRLAWVRGVEDAAGERRDRVAGTAAAAWDSRP